MANENMGPLNRDVLAQILSRVDGATLANASCASLELHGIAQEQRLWEDLCHGIWPSTQGKRTQSLISSLGGFTKFYANSLPLIVYRKGTNIARPLTHVSPSDFVSFIDVYYNKSCIFSKVLYGIHCANANWTHSKDGVDDDGGDELRDGWFLDCPFRFDVLNYPKHNNTLDDDGYDDNPDVQDEEAVTEELPSVPLVEKERGNARFCRNLEENVRLSWIILSTRSGKAVNLSSWKPVSVQRYWPLEGDFIMRFGCVVPVEEQLLPCESGECVISMKCHLLETEGCLRWTEISMKVEDKEGAHVNGRRSLLVLERALSCKRSGNGWKVEMEYGKYVTEKIDAMQKKKMNDGFADRLCLISGVALVASFSFFFILKEFLGISFSKLVLNLLHDGFS